MRAPQPHHIAAHDCRPRSEAKHVSSLVWIVGLQKVFPLTCMFYSGDGNGGKLQRKGKDSICGGEICIVHSQLLLTIESSVMLNMLNQRWHLHIVTAFWKPSVRKLMQKRLLFKVAGVLSSPSHFLLLLKPSTRLSC